MYLNLHIYKVCCKFNGAHKELLVAAHDMTSAEREAFDFWDRHVESRAFISIRSFRIESVSRLGAVVDCTGQEIAAQPA